MSDQTPPDPYGTPAEEPQPPAYGQPNPYGQSNPYETAPPMGGYGMQPAPYASWGKRVLATLIDGVLFIPAAILANMKDSTGLMLAGVALYIGIFVWNICLKGGNTGYTVGKGVMGIKLIKEQTGQPIGAGMAFVRQLAHFLDAIPCYIGYLWPLWDKKRQTFADKIVSSVVIVQPKG